MRVDGCQKWVHVPQGRKRCSQSLNFGSCPQYCWLQCIVHCLQCLLKMGILYNNDVCRKLSGKIKEMERHMSPQHVQCISSLTMLMLIVTGSVPPMQCFFFFLLICSIICSSHSMVCIPGTSFPTKMKLEMLQFCIT